MTCVQRYQINQSTRNLNTLQIWPLAQHCKIIKNRVALPISVRGCRAVFHVKIVYVFQFSIFLLCVCILRGACIQIHSTYSVFTYPKETNYLKCYRFDRKYIYRFDFPEKTWKYTIFWYFGVWIFLDILSCNYILYYFFCLTFQKNVKIYFYDC